MTERSLQKPSRTGRVREARDLRAEGLSVRSVAEFMGVSRSYVYELLSDPMGEASRDRRRAYAERRGGVCVDCGTHVNWQGSYGVPERCASCDSRRKQDSRYWIDRKPPRTFTNDNFLEHLRACHAEQGRASSTAYLRYKEAHPDAPTMRSIAIRFGSWWEAVTRAGFEPGPSRRGPGRFSKEVCVRAVRTVVEMTGEQPSLGSYRRFRRQHPELNLPCEATVRGWFDNSWLAAVGAALDNATPTEVGATRRSTERFT